jgi:hypothetical protein
MVHQQPVNSNNIASSKSQYQHQKHVHESFGSTPVEDAGKTMAHHPPNNPLPPYPVVKSAPIPSEHDLRSLSSSNGQSNGHHVNGTHATPHVNDGAKPVHPQILPANGHSSKALSQPQPPRPRQLNHQQQPHQQHDSDNTTSWRWTRSNLPHQYVDPNTDIPVPEISGLTSLLSALDRRGYSLQPFVNGRWVEENIEHWRLSPRPLTEVAIPVASAGVKRNHVMLTTSNPVSSNQQMHPQEGSSAQKRRVSVPSNQGSVREESVKMAHRPSSATHPTAGPTPPESNEDAQGRRLPSRTFLFYLFHF